MILASAALFLSLPAQDFGRVLDEFVLGNGLTVLFLREPSEESEAREMRMHLCFPNGSVLEPQFGAVAVSLAESQRIDSEQSPGIIRFTEIWVENEVSGISFSVLPGDPDSRLQQIAERLWRRSVRPGVVSFNAGICGSPPLGLRKEDFFPAMLRNSRYAFLPRTGLYPEEFPDALRGFRANLFHPRQTILVVDGGRTAAIERQIRRNFEGGGTAPFSMSYAIVEETAHLSEKSKVIFGRPIRPEFAAVFPAPARGTSDARAFAALVGEAKERFGEERVCVWSGLGTGMFWIWHQSSIPRFSETLPRFVGAIEDFRNEMMESFESHEPLRASTPDAWAFFPERALAARHFWGAGCEDWSNPRATTEEIRAAASAYLRRPALFVLWPESRKDEWKGFP